MSTENLRASATLRDSILVIDYEVANTWDRPIYLANRALQAGLNPDAVDRQAFSDGSASVFLLRSGEVLIFQGPLPIPNPSPYHWPQPYCTAVAPRSSSRASIRLRTPLHQSAHHRGGAPGTIVTATAISLIVEAMVDPESVQQQDGTDAVYVRADRMFRLGAKLQLDTPLSVETCAELTALGEEMAHRIRHNMTYSGLLGRDGPAM